MTLSTTHRVIADLPTATLTSKSAYQARSWEGPKADESTAQGEEGVVDVGTPFVANGQPPILAAPGQGALDHPAMPSQSHTGVDPFAGDAHPDMALVQRPAASRDLGGLVGVQLVPQLAAAVRLRDRGHRV
jgi:hypothetical protein